MLAQKGVVPELPAAAWNLISENAMKAGADSLPVAALYFAMHLAIDNAVESIDRR